MADVLEGGPRRSGPSRRAWWVVGSVAVAVLAAYAVVRHDRSGGAEAGSPPVSTVPGLSISPPGPSPFPSPSPWPTAPGACGSTASLPLMTTRPLSERIGARALVGGYGLRLVDADTRTARSIPGVPADADHMISEIVPSGDTTYLLAVSCTRDSSRIYQLRNGVARPLDGVHAHDLLPGATGVWAVTYPGSGPGGRVVLRRLGGGRPIALPPDAYPVADIDDGLVVADNRPDPSGPSRVALVNRGTGRWVRTVGVGQPLAARGTQLLLLDGACDARRAKPLCTIIRIDVRTGEITRRYPLPPGRVPASRGTFGPDGRRIAFLLQLSHDDPTFDAGHPGPPSGIVLLQLDTGRLDEIPALELPPKTGAGVAITPDGWLLFTVSDGSHAHLVGWRPGLAAPRAAARLPGPVTDAPPVVLA